MAQEKEFIIVNAYHSYLILLTIHSLDTLFIPIMIPVHLGSSFIGFLVLFCWSLSQPLYVPLFCALFHGLLHMAFDDNLRLASPVSNVPSEVVCASEQVSRPSENDGTESMPLQFPRAKVELPCLKSTLSDRLKDKSEWSRAEQIMEQRRLAKYKVRNAHGDSDFDSHCLSLRYGSVKPSNQGMTPDYHVNQHHFTCIW